MKRFTAEEFIESAKLEFSAYWIEADGEDVEIYVPEGMDFANYGMRGDLDGSIIVTGPGHGDSWRTGYGDGDAQRHGAGDGDALRRGDGDGDAWRDGPGNGDAFRRDSWSGKEII